MASAVEARSLSSLTALASNPPKYPRNPTLIREEPLVLYIARVPGSRDVFLTPMKPREKIVTAEDVQSSLYYLHVDRPEDAKYMPPQRSDSWGNGGIVEEPEPLEQQPVSRKPIKPVRPPMFSANAAPNFPRSMRGQQSRSPSPSRAMDRRPMAAPPILSVRTDAANRHNIDSSPITRKPVGSVGARRSMDARVYPSSSQYPGLENVAPFSQGPPPPMREPLIRKVPNPDSPTRLPYPPSPSYLSRSLQMPDQPWVSENGRRPSFPERGSSDPFREPPQRQGSDFDGGASLTLIRRDPASGAQWNVAKIRDPPVFEVSSEVLRNPETRSKKQLGAPMYIEIMNPGYTKFLSGPVDRTVDPSVFGLPRSNSFTSDIEDEVAEKDAQQGIFTRRLWLEGSRFSDRSFGHRKAGSTESVENMDTGRRSLDIRRSLDLLRGNDQLPVPQDGQPQRRRRSNFRGYVFMSPWNGRCEFSTVGAGSTLKCKHSVMLGNPISSSSGAVTVSELRFNLPGLSLFSSAPSAPASDDFSSPNPKRNTLLPITRGRKSSMTGFDAATFRNSSDQPGGWKRLDLSLGQEFAGGGFGGKQAKLGKLIIDDEGLKMMDLLVAANLALWWRAYERVDEKSRLKRRGSVNG